MKGIIPVAVATVLICTSTSGASAQEHQWGYSGEGGPQHWGKLRTEFATCGTGKSQSPIDIGTATTQSTDAVRFEYKPGTTEMMHNGHTVQVGYAPGSVLGVGSRSFELKQIHFHAPSENTINGRHFPLEGHLVHAGTDGALAVVSVMFGEGPPNPLLTSLWQAMPGKAGAKRALAQPLNALRMLPEERLFYRFSGSLTTPPCTEGVHWLVLQKPMTVSRAQVDAFAKAVGFANNRPVQPLNARRVTSP